MLSQQLSMQNIFVYARIVRLWKHSMSEDAGRIGEEILSRMEMFKVFSDVPAEEAEVAEGIATRHALDSAGETGAAKSAAMLLEHFESRSQREQAVDDTDEKKHGSRAFFT